MACKLISILLPRAGTLSLGQGLPAAAPCRRLQLPLPPRCLHAFAASVTTTSHLNFSLFYHARTLSTLQHLLKLQLPSLPCILLLLSLNKTFALINLSSSLHFSHKHTFLCLYSVTMPGEQQCDRQTGTLNGEPWDRHYTTSPNFVFCCHCMSEQQISAF